MVKAREGSVAEENSESSEETRNEMLDCSMAAEFPRPGKVISMNSRDQSTKVHRIMPDSKIKRIA